MSDVARRRPRRFPDVSRDQMQAQDYAHASESKGQSRFQSFHRYLGLTIFLTCLVVYLATLNGVWATDHATAIIEFQYSLWTNHSFALGKVGSISPNSVDVFQFHGSYFMANAPGVAFFTLPFAIISFVMNSHFTVFGRVQLLTEAPIALANSLAAYFVFKIGNFYFKKDVSAFLAFCYAFSTISWPFATYLFQSDVSTLFDLMAVYLAIKLDRSNIDDGGGRSIRLTLLCGLAVAGAVMVDYVNGILIPIIGVYFLAIMRKQRLRLLVKSLISYLFGSIIATLTLLGLYNYLSFGSVIVSSEQLYLHSSSVFGNFSFPIDLGIILNLFTPIRGLFFFSPVLVLGAWGLWKMMRNKRVERDSFLFLSVFLGILGSYSAWYDPEGGLSFGPRLIVSSIPFLLIPAGFVISKATGKYSYSFVYLLYATGVIVNGVAAFVGVLAPPSDNWLTSPFLSYSIPNFVSGNLDIWWKSYGGNLWILIAAAIVGFALLVPMTCSYLSDRATIASINDDSLSKTNAVPKSN